MRRQIEKEAEIGCTCEINQFRNIRALKLTLKRIVGSLKTFAMFQNSKIMDVNDQFIPNIQSTFKLLLSYFTHLTRDANVSNITNHQLLPF